MNATQVTALREAVGQLSRAPNVDVIVRHFGYRMEEFERQRKFIADRELELVTEWLEGLLVDSPEDGWTLNQLVQAGVFRALREAGYDRAKLQPVIDRYFQRGVAALNAANK